MMMTSYSAQLIEERPCYHGSSGGMVIGAAGHHVPQIVHLGRPKDVGPRLPRRTSQSRLTFTHDILHLGEGCRRPSAARFPHARR